MTVIHLASPDAVLRLYRAMPEFDAPLSDAAIGQRLAGHPASAWVAYCDGELAGFKLGYALESRVFYSWLGGVLPAWRQRGVAQQLLTAQEAWAQEAGYGRLQVKTRNRFPAMLRLLIKNHYQIIELEKKGAPADYRLLLEKVL